MLRDRQPSVLPGFRLTLGFTVFYLCLIVLIPLMTLPAADGEHGLERDVDRPLAIHVSSRRIS